MEVKTYTVTKITLTEEEYEILIKAKELCHDIYCEITDSDSQLCNLGADAENIIQDILKLITVENRKQRV